MSETLKEKILKALVEQKRLNQAELDSILDLQKSRKMSLDKILIEKGLISEKELLVFLVKELHIPSINLSKYKIDPSLKDIIPERIARQYRMIPFSKLGSTVTVALSNPLNIFAIDDLKNITGKDIDVIMSTDTEIMKAIDAYYGTQGTASVTDIRKDISVKDMEILLEQDKEVEEVAEEGNRAPIIRMVDLVIKEALKQRASDIHMEPTTEAMRVRYRIDGLLQDILDIPRENMGAVTARIKIMSRLDITVNRLPQDGRFKVRTSHQEVDFRVSLLPTIFGQKIVLRVLDKKNLRIGLEGLGFSKKNFELLKRGIAKPFGMILVTGPTGSGKSTTLYSIINQLNSVDRNIITIEDPVEYLVDGLTQIQARPEIGLTFASGLRAILRQSPDIVMVGEIRDNETADIAIKASLTGQLVLSTLHTNDATGALTRLVDMEVEPFLAASSLIMVCAQRLCRLICPNCKEPTEISEKVLKELGLKAKPSTFYHGKGCKTCRQSGCLGRTVISEILDVDDEIREMLIKGTAADQIRGYAIKEKSMTLLWDDALEKFKGGLISVEEVLRVVSKEE